MKQNLVAITGVVAMSKSKTIVLSGFFGLVVIASFGCASNHTTSAIELGQEVPETIIQADEIIQPAIIESVVQ